MKKFLIGLGVFILLLVVAGVLVVGWYGFVPGLSNYIGPEPRDLGVELTTEHAYVGASAMNMPTNIDQLEAIIADPEAATMFDTTLTSDQASSAMVVAQGGIPNWPLRTVQIRFNGDGTAEASGVLATSELPAFLSGLGVPQDEIDIVYNRIPVLRGNVVVYAAGTCSVTNNIVSLSLSEAQVGRFTVPAAWYQGNEGRGTKYIDGALASNGFQVNSLTTGGDGVTLNGTRPLAAMEPWLHLVSTERGGE